MAISTSSKSVLSTAMLELLSAGASAPVMMKQFVSEKEGSSQVAQRDKNGIATISGGVTYVNSKRVTMGMTLTRAEYDRIDAEAQAKALAWVDKNVHVPLTEPQKVGSASFCPWNIGTSNCFPSTFYRKLNAGDRRGASNEVKRWVHDRGKDCNVRQNNCYGQVIRRDQESEMVCWGIDA